MAKDTQVIVPIEADNRPLKQTLSDTTRAVDSESRKWDQSISQSTNNMQSSMTRALDINRLKDWGIQAAKALFDFGMSCVGAASDLQEVQNVVDVTFGESAREIDSWAKTAINQFGLSETKAKQFASTMGAMMKSAGMAGDEVVKVSEDLAGLAADMSSFYNMDFDTAFQKIRSGISGETEPLKMLGVNMSQANLQAFALQKGITKTLDTMSQGEMVMLRYQYLMEATADAQGDFARTSDGYANATRLLESNLESIRAKIGEVFIPILAGATTALNDFLGAMTKDKPRTVLDDFADIDLKTAEKLKQIEDTANKAETLIQTLQRISSLGDTGEVNNKLAEFIFSMSGSIEGLNTAVGAALDGDTAGAISDLAQALSQQLGGSPEQWMRLLGAVSEKLPSATSATNSDQGKTAEFLEAAAAAADDLGGDYSTLWANLLKAVGDNAGAVVTALANAYDAGVNLGGLAVNANKLNSASPGTWKTFLETLTSIDGLQNIFKFKEGTGIDAFVQALTGNAPDTDKTQAWQTLLGALTEHADDVAKLTGESAEGTKAWLQKISEAVNSIDPTDVQAWDDLLTMLVGDMTKGDGGKQFAETLASNFLALGNQSDVAKNGLLALGFSTDEIEKKQAQWLEICKQLVQTIPSLSKIINVQTGEVNGGADAMREAVEAYKQTQEAMLYWQAYYQKREAQLTQEGNLRILEIEAGAAQIAVDRAKQQHPEFRQAAFQDLVRGRYGDAGKEYAQSLKEATDKQTEFENARRAMVGVTQQLADEEQYLIDKYGEQAQAANNAGQAGADAATQISDATKQAIGDTEKALKTLKDYTDQVYKSSVSSVESTLGGFNKVLTLQEQAKQKTTDLKKQLTGEITDDQRTHINQLITDANNAVPSVQNLTDALKSQLDFLCEYYNNLAKMREMGFSDEVIAMLSDGSVQSASYAKALIDATGNAKAGQVKEINDLVDNVKRGTEKVSETLTENKLKVDETYQGLVQTAADAVAKLDKEAEAKGNVAKTMQGIIDGLSENEATVRAQVDNILSMLAELTGGSYGVTIPGVNMNVNTGGNVPITINTNVNLNGQTVGNAVSQYQADQYNQQQRSGVMMS